MKYLTTLTTLFQFIITKMKYLTTLTTLFCFTTLKMKSLTTLTTLFYFTTTDPKDCTTLSTLFLSLIHEIVFPQEFQCFHKICMRHSNFTVRKFSGVLMLYYPPFRLPFMLAKIGAGGVQNETVRIRSYSGLNARKCGPE